jgi:hypothetical protein
MTERGGGGMSQDKPASPQGDPRGWAAAWATDEDRVWALGLSEDERVEQLVAFAQKWATSGGLRDDEHARFATLVDLTNELAEIGANGPRVVTKGGTSEFTSVASPVDIDRAMNLSLSELGDELDTLLALVEGGTPLDDAEKARLGGLVVAFRIRSERDADDD